MKNFLVLICFLLGSLLHAQDVIFKTNGDSIKAKVLEIGVNDVSYKKFSDQNGPTFVESKKNILLIRLSKGEVIYFDDAAKAGSPDNQAKNQNDQKNNSSSAKDEPEKSGPKVKIERTDDGYTIDGQSATKKQVDKQLGTSKNPAILLGLKGAKGMSTAQKIVKITSYPSTIIGGPLALVKVIDLWNDVQRGRTTSKSYTNFIFSFLPTITMPITNKILKNKSNKMYDKLIDMYNVTN